MISKKILFLINLIFMVIMITGCGSVTKEYTLTITYEGLGKVTDPQGYAIVSRIIAANSVVSLVPSGETGTWCFERWDGPNGSEVKDNKIIMNGDKNITAVFKRLTHAINITYEGQGTVSRELLAGATSLTLYNGDKIRLSPNPATGWAFDHWEEDEVISYEAIREIVVDEDKYLKAVFVEPISYSEMRDDAEGSNSLMCSSDTWEKTNLIYHSGTYSWTDSPGGNYTNNANSILMSTPVDLTGNTMPYLTFWRRFNLDSNNDTCLVEISTDNSKSWVQLKSFSHIDTIWRQVSINLSAYKDQNNIRFRFRLTSDSSTTNDGWYVDDIQIVDQPIYSYTNFYENAETDSPLLIPDGPWAKSGSNYFSPSNCWTDSPDGNYDYNTNISLTTFPINLTGSVLPYLVFWHRYDITNNARLDVEISVNDGESWSTLKIFWSGSNTWHLEEINLTSYKNQSNIIIRFRLSADNSGTLGDGWYIDDIRVTDMPVITYTEFHDDAETEPSLLISDGSWSKISSDNHSSSLCWTDSPIGSYNNNTDSILITKHINLTGSNLPYLTFWHHYDINNIAGSSDYGYVLISDNDGVYWSTLQSFTGINLTWRQENISLENYKNSGNILIRFYLHSDSAGTGGGVGY